ncbi:MAG: hypothetical protein GC164_15020 [Phycisphaera sp.]|nr:hypothetical protein [Phycisphaera sp.]
MNRPSRKHNPQWALHTVGITMTLAMLAACGFVGVRPLLESQRSLSETSGKLIAQRKELAAAQASTSGLQRSLEEVTLKLQAIPVQLRSPQQVNEYLAQLVTIGQRTGVEVMEVKPIDRNATEGGAARFMGWTDIVLRGRGNYKALHRFLERVREELSDTEIDSMEMGYESPDPAVGLRIGMRLRWFHAGRADRSVAGVDTERAR